MKPTRNNASILRKKILQEIKKLLNERALDDLADAINKGAKSLADVAILKNDFKAALRAEMDALETAGKDISQLRKVYDNIGSIKDTRTFVEALGEARAKVKEAASGVATSATSSAKAAADVTDNPAVAQNAIQDITRTDPQSAAAAKNIIDQGTKVPKKDRLAWFKKWFDSSMEYCRNKPKTCASIGAGLGLGVAALAYVGIKGSEVPPISGGGGGAAGGGASTPKPTPAQPEAPAETTGTPNVKTQSIRCAGDTPKNSIVARYQRLVGVTPDGVFGKKTYIAGQKKGGDAALPDSWESYFTGDANTSAKRICTWLTTPGKSWSELDPKIGAGGKGKGAGGKGKGAGGGLSYTIKLLGDSLSPDFAQSARAIAELLTNNLSSVLNLKINTDSDGMQDQDRLYRLLKRKLIQAQGMSEQEIANRIKPTFVEYYGEEEESQSEEERSRREEETENIQNESWHRKHQTSYSNNLFERLVKSTSGKKVI